MEHKEKLRVVETAIRKALPRLMEPTEGCWLKHKHKSEAYSLYKVCEHNSNDELEVSDILILTPTGRIKVAWFDHEDELESFNNTFTIIGHDILLSDVLEWLSKLNENNYDEDTIPTFNTKGYSVYARCYGNEGFLREGEKLFDFSKQYLKDQSEELINYLYNLIEK